MTCQIKFVEELNKTFNYKASKSDKCIIYVHLEGLQKGFRLNLESWTIASCGFGAILKLAENVKASNYAE